MPSLAKRSSAVVAFVVMTEAPFVTSQVALDDFVGFLHERAPSSWPRNAETSRPTVFWRDGDWRCESSLARAETGTASTLCNEAQAPTAEMAVAPPSIRKSAPTTYAESSDARETARFAISTGSASPLLGLVVRRHPLTACPR